MNLKTFLITICLYLLILNDNSKKIKQISRYDNKKQILIQNIKKIENKITKISSIIKFSINSKDFINKKFVELNKKDLEIKDILDSNNLSNVQLFEKEKYDFNKKLNNTLSNIFNITNYKNNIIKSLKNAKIQLESNLTSINTYKMYFYDKIIKEKLKINKTSIEIDNLNTKIGSITANITSSDLMLNNLSTINENYNKEFSKIDNQFKGVNYTNSLLEFNNNLFESIFTLKNKRINNLKFNLTNIQNQVNIIKKNIISNNLKLRKIANIKLKAKMIDIKNYLIMKSGNLTVKEEKILPNFNGNYTLYNFEYKKIYNKIWENDKSNEKSYKILEDDLYNKINELKII